MCVCVRERVFEKKVERKRKKVTVRERERELTEK